MFIHSISPRGYVYIMVDFKDDEKSKNKSVTHFLFTRDVLIKPVRIGQTRTRFDNLLLASIT